MKVVPSFPLKCSYPEYYYLVFHVVIPKLTTSDIHHWILCSIYPLLLPLMSQYVLTCFFFALDIHFRWSSFNLVPGSSFFLRPLPQLLFQLLLFFFRTSFLNTGQQMVIKWYSAFETYVLLCVMFSWTCL